MPKVNLPMGVYGIFVPATDLVTIPASDPIVVAPGVLAKTGMVYLNLTKFLQQYASGPNAAMGGQFGAGMLAGFDIAYSGSAPTALALTETQYANGQQPVVKNSSNTPQFVLSPTSLPTAAADPAITVTFVSLADYWLIGQNNPNVADVLAFDAGGNVYGVTIYFGNK